MDKLNKNITGVMVACNTRDFVKRAYESVRAFHPDMRIIIVDGSDVTDPCFKYIETLRGNNQIVQVGYNIGHGRGMCTGLYYTETPYVLFFDSDIEMLKSPVKEMFSMFEEDTFGVGYIEKTGFDGFNYGAHAHHLKEGWMPYLHPFFELVKISNYKKYYPYIHHGAPCLLTMYDIFKRGLSDKVLKEFSGLGHSSGQGFTWKGIPREFIKHDVAGTRTIRKSKGQAEIGGVWELNHGRTFPIVEAKRSKDMTVTCVTPTGDRPEAFELCRKWMFGQRTKFDQWLVIDDGKVPLPEHLRVGLEYFRREPTSGERFTLTANMKAALPYIKGDIILIIEDDDWYGPDYITTMSKYLSQYDLVGELAARYYHLPTMKCRRIGNNTHASFCQTGFTKKILPVLKTCLEGDSYIDVRLWAAVKDRKYLIADTNDSLKLHCAIKGLKGRKGIGTGHNQNAGFYFLDIGLAYLIKWVGEENAKIYMDHIGQSFESAKLIGVDEIGRGQKIAAPIIPSTPRPSIARPQIPRRPIPLPPRKVNRPSIPRIPSILQRGVRKLPPNWR